jgi:EpsI family protein
MRNLTRFAPAAILGVGCLLISGMREQKRMPPRVPMSAMAVPVEGFTTSDTVIAAAERKVAGMSDYVLRFYRRGPQEPPFSIYVGYYDYQVQGKAIHSQKNCLPGAGWEALASSVQPVAAGGTRYSVNRYLLANSGAQALVYYWYQGRGRLEANEYRVKYNLMHDAALYGRTEEALVRIVVPIDPAAVRAGRTGPAYAAADSLASRVAGELIPAVTKAMPVSPAT